MSFTGLLLLIISQFIIGRGLLYVFKVKDSLVNVVMLSTLIGIACISMLPMFIEMLRLPINKTNIMVSIAMTVISTNILAVRHYRLPYLEIKKLKFPELYEIVFIIVLIFLMIPSVWRCYYYPPNARDVLSGPEALSHYAILEHKVNNSVFSINLLDSTPNLLKPPFLTNLQIIYKMFVHPFGQIWLTILVVSFLVWIYNIIRKRLHPVLTGALIVMLVAIPELYGYSYVLLWDYSNMIFYFAGIYYLYEYINNKQYNYLFFSSLLFGFATFIRLDSLVFIGLTALLTMIYLWKDDVSIKKLAISTSSILVIPLAFYFLWIKIFIPNYLPHGIVFEDNFKPGSVPTYFEWLQKMNGNLIFGGDNLDLYSYFIYLFILVLLIDIIVYRKFNKEAIFLIICIAIIFFGMPLISYFTNWFNITTAKRGIFKMFPLMILYYTRSSTFLSLNTAINNFENKDLSTSPKPIATIKPVNKKKK